MEALCQLKVAKEKHMLSKDLHPLVAQISHSLWPCVDWSPYHDMKRPVAGRSGSPLARISTIYIHPT